MHRRTWFFLVGAFVGLALLLGWALLAWHAFKSPKA